jgi:hypothetical protein
MGETVFFGYDRAALDREYNNSGKVANAAEYLTRYSTESARARETLPARLDLRYGPQSGETLDIFLPEGHGPWPVHVFVHGGYWRSLDKQDFSFIARAFQPAGVLVAVIDYALIRDEYHRQTESLAGAWRRRGLFVEVMDMAGHDHFSIITELEAPDTPLSRAILRQIGVSAPTPAPVRPTAR